LDRKAAWSRHHARQLLASTIRRRPLISGRSRLARSAVPWRGMRAGRLRRWPRHLAEGA